MMTFQMFIHFDIPNFMTTYFITLFFVISNFMAWDYDILIYITICLAIEACGIPIYKQSRSRKPLACCKYSRPLPFISLIYCMAPQYHIMFAYFMPDFMCIVVVKCFYRI